MKRDLLQHGTKFVLLLILIAMLTLAIVLLTAYSSNAVRTVEVTRLAPQTVQVTIIVTPTPPTSASLTPETEYSVYFDGILVITQYYKLLDQASYEDAYQILGGSAKQHASSLESYIASSTRAFKSVKIVAIQPYDEWVRQQGHQPTLDPELKYVFFVQIVAEGEGTMSGSAVSGEVQTLFITVAQEDGQWKVASFSTGRVNAS
jgi:hypothetical protein